MSETLVTTFGPNCQCGGTVAVSIIGKEGAAVKVTCVSCDKDWTLIRAPLKADRPSEIGDTR